MLDVLQDLFRHQEWADATHWRAIRASEAACQDEELKERLVHLHGAQQRWLGRWQGVTLGFAKAGDYASTEDVFHFAQACHAALRAFLSLQSEASVAKEVHYTTGKGETFTRPLSALMLHLALHSQYHRGQNATRLRILAGEAPGTDFDTWQQEGRPMAAWD